MILNRHTDTNRPRLVVYLFIDEHNQPAHGIDGSRSLDLYPIPDFDSPQVTLRNANLHNDETQVHQFHQFHARLRCQPFPLIDEPVYDDRVIGCPDHRLFEAIFLDPHFRLGLADQSLRHGNLRLGWSGFGFGQIGFRPFHRSPCRSKLCPHASKFLLRSSPLVNQRFHPLEIRLVAFLTGQGLLAGRLQTADLFGPLPGEKVLQIPLGLLPACFGGSQLQLVFRRIEMNENVILSDRLPEVEAQVFGILASLNLDFDFARRPGNGLNHAIDFGYHHRPPPWKKIAGQFQRLGDRAPLDAHQFDRHRRNLLPGSGLVRQCALWRIGNPMKGRQGQRAYASKDDQRRQDPSCPFSHIIPPFREVLFARVIRRTEFRDRRAGHETPCPRWCRFDWTALPYALRSSW